MRGDRALVGVYGWMAVMETVGFAAFFHDPLVAAVGGAAMVPLAAVAARRVWTVVADVVVVGGGVGGLAATLRLRAAGHAVDRARAPRHAGGQARRAVRDGFTFDVGPSLLTLPDVLDDVFRLAGTRLAAEVDLVRLDPQIRYHWPDGTGFDVCDDPGATSRAFEAFSPGAPPRTGGSMAQGSASGTSASARSWPGR